MSHVRLHDALQDSLDALARGEDLGTALGIHPRLAADVQPALQAALALRSLPLVEAPLGARRRSKARLQAALEAGRRRRGIPVAVLPRFAGGVAAAALAIMTGLGGLAVASAQALPGDALYPIKRASEAVQLRLTLPQRARLALEDSYATRRADEVRRLLELGRTERVIFEGIVQGQSETSWLVADIRVVVPSGISVTPGIESGMTIQVRGETQPEGHFLAQAIQLLGFQYAGPVRFISPETWTVGDHSFAILSDTWIEPGIGLGEDVLVSVRFLPSGDLAGRAVLGLVGDAEPTSTSRPTIPYTTPTTPIPSTPSPDPEARGTESATDQPEEGDESHTGSPTGTPSGSHDQGSQNDEVEFEGVVENQSPPSWVISGTLVIIDSDTEIKDDPQVGDSVKVEAVTQADGQLLATKIEKED